MRRIAVVLVVAAGLSIALAANPRATPFEVTGRTQPVLGRMARIAPVVLHDVEKVHVKLGAAVKAGQLLIQLDDDEPKAELEGKKAALAELKAGLARHKALPREEERAEARAALDAARIGAVAAKEQFERIDPLWRQGAITEQRHHDARANLQRSEAEQRAAAARLARLLKQPIELETAELEARIQAAEAAVKVAEAELDHYGVKAPIDGIIASLDVCPGEVARPGTTIWGEILDLSELDVRCELSPELADRLTLDQSATVSSPSRPGVRIAGKVTYIGIAADPKTGRIPVLIRVSNPELRLRCYVEVKVSFEGP